jgi:replicative DNA helicase
MTDPMQAGDAEVYLLGAAMSGYPRLDDLAALVEEQDFYSPFHGQVWDAVLRVHNAGNKPDPMSVRLALSAAEVKHDPTRLVDYTQSVPVLANAPHYAEQVANAAGLRRIQTAGVKLQQLGGAAGDLEERREQARQAVDEATSGKARSKARTLAALLPEVIDTAQHGQTNVLGTGWPDLDRVIGGLAPGRLVVIGARPGVGKSICGTNLALHFAQHHGHAVLIASLEMPETEVGQRMLSAHAGVNLTGLQMGTTDEAAWQRIAKRTDELAGLPVTVDDAPGQTVTAIRRAARDVQRERDDLALIVVDYLQLVRPSDTRVNRSEQIGEISRGLKLLARETGACVVAMAQVNREGTKHSDGKPRMTDLRESGAIEADADQVILMHQPDDEIPELELIVDKNRHGPKGLARLQVQGHYARLVSVEWTPSRGAIA